MRLIDADALLESARVFEIVACARGCGKSILHLAKAWLFCEVEKAPTIDAVEVVRCKDCEYWNEDALACDTLPWVSSSEHANWYAEDFCSYGKRKGGESDE